MLGRNLVNNGFHEQGKKLIEISLSNIKQVLPDDERPLKELSPENFIDCYIKAFYWSASEYEKWKAELLLKYD